MRLGLLQGDSQILEVVLLLNQKHLEQEVHFILLGGTTSVQLLPVPEGEGASLLQEVQQPVCITDGLHQVLVALLE